MKPLRLATICSGIGAPECAAAIIGGFEHVFASEIEDFPSAVLAHHFPETPNLGDFTKIGADWHGAVDVLVGGTPCQSFSVAGKRLGLDDPRGNLTLEFLALVGRIRPRWVVWENVPGVLTIDGGEVVATVCRTLEEFGYEVGCRILDARHFGVPQRRRRLFVGAGPRDRARSALRRDADRRRWRAAARHATWPGEVGEDAPRAADRGGDDRGPNDRIAPALTASGRGVARCGESRGDDPLVVTCAARNIVQSGTAHLENAAVPLTTSPDDSLVVCAASKRDGISEFGDSAPALRAGSTTARPIVAFDSKRGAADAGELAPTLRATPHDRSHMNGGGGIAVAYCPETADTLTRTIHKAVAGAGNSPKLRNVVAFHDSPASSVGEVVSRGDHGEGSVTIRTPDGRTVVLVEWRGEVFRVEPDRLRLRRLTPLETERLQGFPDDWTNIPWRGKPAPDSRRYKAVGNSMAVPVLAWILEGIRDEEEGTQA